MGGKLLILHDSADFGGHERMLLALLPGLLDGPDCPAETVFYLPSSNRRLRDAVATTAPSIRIVDWPFVKRRGEPYLHWFRLSYRAAVRRIFRAERPDRVLLVQGRIEHLAVPAATLPRDTKVVSFLPMAHRMSEMGRSGIGGDRVRRALYRRPDHFIVPSEAVADQVRLAGSTGAITVAHNVVEASPRSDRRGARQALGLSSSKRIALFLGRLEARQKGLDSLVSAMRRAGTGTLAEWIFVFVGEGDAAPLLQAAADEQLADIRLVPWTERPDLYLSAADILLLPSRWEGVPLVMLEAMQFGLPIMASQIDVFRQYLPEPNLVDFDTIDLGERLAALSTTEATQAFADHAVEKLRPLTLASARNSFAAALMQEAA